MSGFFVPHNLKSPLKGAESGLLAGLTAAVKDMYDIAGERCGGGNPDWLANTRPATSHATAVAKMLDAGATIVGKAICDEFFYSVAGINAHYGTPTNMRAPGRIPGGSSSGSAAATAAGACDFALGSDTGGSVRIPASFCGLYGIRTTQRRVDTKGCMDMAPSFDTIGWFANGAGVFRNVGMVLLGGEPQRAAVSTLLIADDGFAEAETRWARCCASHSNACSTRYHRRSTRGSRRTALILGAKRCASSRPTRSGRCTAASSRRSIRGSAPASPSA